MSGNIWITWEYVIGETTYMKQDTILPQSGRDRPWSEYVV
jgi:hypothetical protein